VFSNGLLWQNFSDGGLLLLWRRPMVGHSDSGLFGGVSIVDCCGGGAVSFPIWKFYT
jgi:hypothetical protein